MKTVTVIESVADLLEVTDNSPQPAGQKRDVPYVSDAELRIDGVSESAQVRLSSTADVEMEPLNAREVIKELAKKCGMKVDFVTDEQ